MSGQTPEGRRQIARQLWLERNRPRTESGEINSLQCPEGWRVFRAGDDFQARHEDGRQTDALPSYLHACNAAWWIESDAEAT